jgi:hypothetical protein
MVGSKLTNWFMGLLTVSSGDKKLVVWGKCLE